MAQQPKQPCRECKALSDGPYCDKHKGIPREHEREYNRVRWLTDPFRKLYNTARWRKAVCPIILARDIYCQSGLLCTNPETGVRDFATEVDHVIPARIYVAQHSGDTNSFYDESNLQGLCSRCHKSKTRTERAGSNVVEPAEGWGTENPEM